MDTSTWAVTDVTHVTDGVADDGQRQHKRPSLSTITGESKRTCRRHKRGNVEATVIRDVANGKPSDPKNPSSHEDLLDPKGTISITSNHIITKSDVFGLPPAWAENRAEISCGALPWFRAYQGAVYQNNGRCYGFLLSGDGGEHTYIDNEVVITRVGGDCEKMNGRLVLQKDQNPDHARVRALRRLMEEETLVGLIIGGEDHPLGRKLPYQYNVMGLFRTTHIWEEKVDGHAAFKVRFEKNDLSQMSWWAKKSSPLPLPVNERDFERKPISIECAECNQKSLWVYSEAWMCLQRSCDQFGKVNKDIPASRTFHPDFLNSRSPPDSSLKHPLAFTSNVAAGALIKASVFTEDGWKGIVCEECGRCVPRRHWACWQCPSCGFKLEIAPPIVSIARVCPAREMSLKAIERTPSPPRWDDVQWEVDKESLSPYLLVTYRLGKIGSVTHILAGRDTNCRPGGPDDMFRELQQGELGLERRKLKAAVVDGTLTAHFSVNYGMPYKFIVPVDNHGFAGAPDVALRGLGRLMWATERAALSEGDCFKQPNELLVLGYFKGMHIGYHDDGEDTLGPTIATLSLGAKSVMRIRMKSNYYHGPKGGKNVHEEDPVLPGCIDEEERRELKTKLEGNLITQTKYEEQRLQMRRKSSRLKTTPKKPPRILEMNVAHGDMVVMHGAMFQKYYEHEVIPDGDLRFALTARYVKPGMIENGQHALGQFNLTPAQEYHGQ